MWDWCDELRLGTSSCAFVKRDIRSLPLADAEFEADFFFHPKYSTKRHERWAGMVIERESGALLAAEEVQLPPPTVNGLANLLAHAMLRPRFGDRQRPRIIYLRDRPQWQELLAHLRQLGIEVVLGQDLPWFDEAAIEWLQDTTKGEPPSADEIRAVLREPFPKRKRTWFTANNPPFLIIQGTKDPVVNFTQSERFFAALQKAGVDATFIRVIGGGHGNFPTPAVPQRIRAFFDKHLRGKEVSISAEPISVEGRRPDRYPNMEEEYAKP